MSITILTIIPTGEPEWNLKHLICENMFAQWHYCWQSAAAALLPSGEQLVILLGDQGAKDDIPKYFKREGFSMQWLDTPASRLLITKK
jgi:hypothetical protein